LQYFLFLYIISEDNNSLNNILSKNSMKSFG